MLSFFARQLARSNLTEMAILLFYRNDINIVLNFPATEKVVLRHIYGHVLLADFQVSFIQLLASIQHLVVIKLLALFQPQLPMIQFLIALDHLNAVF